MVSNKKRLHVALYPSGIASNSDRKYHWAFLIGPKAEDQDEVPGMRYHVKNLPCEGWIYEEFPLDNVRDSSRLLARVLIAKIMDEARLVEILQSIPIVQNDRDWRCRTWIENVLAEMEKDGKAVGTAMLDWREIEGLARRYVGGKVATGRYMAVKGTGKSKPTWDMLRDREIVP